MPGGHQAAPRLPARRAARFSRGVSGGGHPEDVDVPPPPAAIYCPKPGAGSPLGSPAHQGTLGVVTPSQTGSGCTWERSRYRFSTYKHVLLGHFFGRICCRGRADLGALGGKKYIYKKMLRSDFERFVSLFAPAPPMLAPAARDAARPRLREPSLPSGGAPRDRDPRGRIPRDGHRLPAAPSPVRRGAGSSGSPLAFLFSPANGEWGSPPQICPEDFKGNPTPAKENHRGKRFPGYCPPVPTASPPTTRAGICEHPFSR